MWYLVLEELTHFFMELFLVLDLPIQIFNLTKVILDLLRRDKRLLRVFIYVSILLWGGRFLDLFNWDTSAPFWFEKHILLLLSYNDVALWLFSDIYSWNLIALVLIYIFVGEQTLLANKRYLLICPYFHAVVPFLLNFLPKLINSWL